MDLHGCLSSPILVLGTAILTTVIVTVFLLKFKNWLPLDRPNHRSMHFEPVPRTGGVAIVVAVAGSMYFADVVLKTELLATALVLAGIFFIDDVRGLSVRIRFAAQILAATFLLWMHSRYQLGIGLFVFCVLTITWMTNVYNFMDGSDGLAAGMTVVGFGAFSIAAWNAGAMELAILSTSIVGSGLGFLFFNFHPARIFMGDVGSIPTGYLAGGIGIVGWLDGIWPLAFPALVFSPFLVDATVTLAVRVVGRRPVWQAHREHFYQKLILLGLGHQRTALLEYALMVVCAVGGLVLLIVPQYLLQMTIAWVAGYAALLWTIQGIWLKSVAGKAKA